MRVSSRRLAFSAAVCWFLTAVSAYSQTVTEIGGQKLITLRRAAVSTTKPEFTSVTIAPGRGMEILYITANFPGKGQVQVLASPEIATIKHMLDLEDNAIGDLGHRFGAAFLVPYPNRIRGKLSADGKSVTTRWRGHSLTLPANGAGKLPGSEPYAIHGLILKAKTDGLRQTSTPGSEQVTGVIHAGSFGGHWLSKTDLVVTITLTGAAVDASIVAHNVGSEDEPIAIGWHPYFNLPSGDRAQVRLRIPGAYVAQVDNYNDVFPTGQLLPVDGTPYDLRALDGKPLGKQPYDDNWSHLAFKDGAATVKVIDPAAHYGVEVQGLSPEIRTIQAYSPPTSNFVAVEHQFNFGDPFGSEWGMMDTGMVTLEPGQSTRWHMRLRVFAP